MNNPKHGDRTGNSSSSIPQSTKRNSPSVSADAKTRTSPWGDTITYNPGTAFRLVFENINGFPIHQSQRFGASVEQVSKNYKFKQQMLRFQPHVIGLSECNAAWKLLPSNQQLASLVFGWWQRCTAHAAYFEQFASTDPHRVGGVALLTTGDTVSRIIDRGVDPTGLGRWPWVTLQGRHNMKVVIVSAYRPCKSTKGLETVWSQQQSFFQRQTTDTTTPAQLGTKQKVEDPVYWFDKHLQEALIKWHDAHAQIILGIDANSNVITGPFADSLKNWA